MSDNILDDKSDRGIDLRALRRNLLPLWYKVLHGLLLGVGIYGMVGTGIPGLWDLLTKSTHSDFIFLPSILDTLGLLLETGLIITSISILYGQPWALKAGMAIALYFILFFIVLTVAYGYLELTVSKFAFPLGIDLYLLYTYYRLCQAWADPEFFESPL